MKPFNFLSLSLSLSVCLSVCLSLLNLYRNLKVQQSEHNYSAINLFLKIIKHGNYSKHRCMSWTHTDNTSIRVCTFWGTIRPVSQYVSSRPCLVVRNLKLPVTNFLFTQGPKCNPPRRQYLQRTVECPDYEVIT